MPLGEGDGCGAGGGEIAAAVEEVEVGAQSGFAANVKLNAVDSDWKNENLKSVDGKAPVADDSCYRAGQT